ncbi:UvrABC system protein A OS=Streptomyces tendae OX=1932 GN=GUR47_01395 PE=3 SV=1 [Streptomyces tendae]
MHPSDVQRVVDALDMLLDSGNTVVVAEHDIPVAASADWVIDLGPVAGPDGGAVVAQGTPDSVADADTPTAGYLRRYAAGRPLLDASKDTRR